MLLALTHIDNDCAVSAGVAGAGVGPGFLAGMAQLDSLDFDKSGSLPCIIIDKERTCST